MRFPSQASLWDPHYDHMIRRIIAVLLTTLCVSVFTAGCARTDSAQKRYAQWNQTDWETAPAEEKKSAIRYLAAEVAASCPEDEKVSQPAIDDAIKSFTAPQFDDIEDALDEYFATAQSGDTLQNAVSTLYDTFGRYLPID